MFQTIFKRYEKKYLLNEKQYFAVLETLKNNALPDKYSKSTVCSIYYDTPDKRLIRASIERPVYKENLRLRSYGVPNGSSGMAQGFSGDSSQASFMYTLDSSAKAGGMGGKPDRENGGKKPFDMG